jgi:hypothetical protein
MQPAVDSPAPRNRLKAAIWILGTFAVLGLLGRLIYAVFDPDGPGGLSAIKGYLPVAIGFLAFLAPTLALVAWLGMSASRRLRLLSTSRDAEAWLTIENEEEFIASLELAGLRSPLEDPYSKYSFSRTLSLLATHEGLDFWGGGATKPDLYFSIGWEQVLSIYLQPQDSGPRLHVAVLLSGGQSKVVIRPLGAAPFGLGRLGPGKVAEVVGRLHAVQFANETGK